MKRAMASGSVAASLFVASTCPAREGPAAFPLPCTFLSVSGELEVENACATMRGEAPVLSPHVLARLSYSAGLASFALRGSGWYHRRRDGTTRRIYVFDNGPDAFEEGLARAIVEGKIAYVDRRLRIRIRTRYDWGDRFDHGRAAVCIGCRSVPVGDGEHRVMQGGRWGMIDRSGREIVPVTLTGTAFVAQRDRVR